MNTIIQNLKNETKLAQESFANIASTDNVNCHAAQINMEVMKEIYKILDTQCAKIKPKRDVTSRKVVFIGDEQIDAKSSKQAVEIVCRHLITNHYKEFCSNLDKMKSSVTGKKFASKDPNEIEENNRTEIKVGRKVIYIDPYRMTTNNMMLFKKMMSLLPTNDVRIENITTNIA